MSGTVCTGPMHDLATSSAHVVRGMRRVGGPRAKVRLLSQTRRGPRPDAVMVETTCYEDGKTVRSTFTLDLVGSATFEGRPICMFEYEGMAHARLHRERLSHHDT